MTQENTSINIHDAETSTIENAEIRAENIEFGVNTAIDSYRINDYVPSEKLVYVNSVVDEIVDDTFVDSVNALVDSIITPEEKALSAKIKQDQDEYLELKETLDEPIHKLIIKRLRKANVPFYSNSNISEYITDDERESLIDEATEAYAKFMECLAIDIEHDPNAHDSPRRVAKQFINELMRGRYYPAPAATSFPNKHTGKETGFSGLLVVRAELISVCSHHHATVKGVAYIGIIPKENVIGLSKYIRLAQWCARRGTLQEELAEDIATTIQQYTGSDDVGILIEATHNCVSCRGVMQDDSTTNTTVLKGQFMSDGVLRKEFHDNIMFQKMKK